MKDTPVSSTGWKSSYPARLTPLQLLVWKTEDSSPYVTTGEYLGFSLWRLHKGSAEDTVIGWQPLASSPDFATLNTLRSTVIGGTMNVPSVMFKQVVQLHRDGKEAEVDTLHAGYVSGLELCMDLIANPTQESSLLKVEGIDLHTLGQMVAMIATIQHQAKSIRKMTATAC